MKSGYYLTFIFIVFIFGCSKEENFYSDVVIQTNKVKYTTEESVMIKISNKHTTEISYSICSSYYGIPPSVLKYSDNEWASYWSPICNGYASGCCEELNPKEIYSDTLNLNFEKGKYKIEYNFIVKHGEGYVSFYSNEFQVE